MHFLLEKLDFHCYVGIPEGKLQAFCMIITVLELQCIFEYSCLIFPLALSFLFIESTAVGLGSFGMLWTFSDFRSFHDGTIKHYQVIT